MKRRYSENRKILRSITSKMRQLEPSMEAKYLIIYAFLYKCCSDRLRQYFSRLCAEMSVSMSDAFMDEYSRQILKEKALKQFGYFISSPGCFIDEVIYATYSEGHFIYSFFDAFSENVEFEDDSRYSQYFDYIFSQVEHAVNFNKFEFTDPNHLIVKEIIFAVSKLNVFEEEFPFEKVFDRICQSRLVRTEHDPDYITHLISALVASKAENPRDVYNPFLNDASLLVNLRECGFTWQNTYSKSQDNMSYFTGLVKLIIYDFDMNRAYCEFGSPFESVEDLSRKFDVIVSRFPPITSKNLKRMSITQSQELLKQNKLNQVKSLLSDKLNIEEDSFENNSELSNALENLIDKMDLDLELDSQFVGEYESLKNSEYLFLINMISCLTDDGIMAVSMHQSFLVKNSLRTLRKFLTVAKNYVDAIISIPDELSRTSRLEIIMVFRKNRNTDDIVFIDLSKNFKTKKAPYIVPGLFTKNLILDDSTISGVLDVYTSRKAVDKFSEVVGIDELKVNDYNLSISRYVDTFEGEFISLDSLANQKAEIDENLEKLNEKIDYMMKELDIRL